MQINKTIKNINRISEIIGLLIKYGFEDMVANSPLRKMITKERLFFWRKMQKETLHLTRWERIRMAIEELGPSYVKFAQMLSNRPDIIPEPLIAEFEKLQDHVKPYDSQIAKSIIEYELGKPIGELFDFFQDRPFASASISQVHRAKLKSGEDVAVKVQRPGIEKLIIRDIEVLRMVVDLTSKYLKKQGIINPEEIVSDYEHALKSEINFQTEAQNIAQFRQYYHNRKNLYIPKVYASHTRKKVLTTEFIIGCKITDSVQYAKLGIDPVVTINTLIDIYLSQIFEHGYFHADPHPGNILVRDDGTLCLIDFGLVGKLIATDKIAFANIFASIVQRDTKKMADCFIRLADNPNFIDARILEYDLKDLIDEFSLTGDTNIIGFRKKMQNLIYTHRIKVPYSVFLILKTLVVIEAIAKTVVTDTNIKPQIEHYGQKVGRAQYSPKLIISELLLRANQMNYFLRNFPNDLNQVLKTLQKGKLHIEYEIQGTDSFFRKLDRITNRFIIAAFIVALILAGALVITARLPRQAIAFYYIPYISLVCWIIAALLTVILLFNSRNQKP